MKVLIIAPYFFERHRWMISAYKTALHLSRRMDVVVLTTGRPAEEQLNNRLRIYRMRDWFIPDPVNYSVVPTLAWNLWWVIRREQPDVFLVNKHMFFTSFSVWLLRWMGKKVILATDTFPGMNWYPRHPLVRVVMVIYAYLIGWPILKSAHRLVVYHEGLLPAARRLGLHPQVIHNGVDIAAIQTALPAKLTKQANEVFVCYIGRLESIKGYDDILTVAQQLVPRQPNVKFFFIGSYHGKEELVRQNTSPQIQFLGHRDDIYGLLKQMDIFVLASYSEGLPNALMESMAAGLACVASRVGGVQVLLTEGQTGLMFKAGDQPELAQKLNQLIENPALRQRLGRAAQNRIVQDFNWDTIASQYQQLFQQVVTT